MLRSRHCLTIALACWLGCAPAAAQPTEPQPATPVTPGINSSPQPGTGAAGADAAAARLRDYRVGPGDVVSVSVLGVDSLNVTTRVSNSGKIHVTQVGIVLVANQTVSQIAATIAARLKAMDLVNEPSVMVKVEEYRAQPVYILGEVEMPGQYVITDEIYVADLLIKAMGLNEVASPTGFLYRRTPRDKAVAAHPEGPGVQETALYEEAIPIDFAELSTSPETNLKLRGGDILYVPERRKVYFFVIGAVSSPGLFELPDGKPIRVSQAIARAGGPVRTAKSDEAILVRYGADGTRQELPLNLKDILRGRQPDLFVQLNDIIFVPGSAAKTVTYSLLGIIPGLATGAVAR